MKRLSKTRIISSTALITIYILFVVLPGVIKEGLSDSEAEMYVIELDYSEVKALCAGNPNKTRGAYGKRAILRYLQKSRYSHKAVS